MSSPLQGMHFSSSETFFGHTVHFNMQTISGPSSPSDLLIRLKNDVSLYDLVPPRTLSGILPNSLVEDFVHWYRHDELAIEFRLLHTPWKTESRNWSLGRHGSKWKLTRYGRTSLISPTSSSGQYIASILAPLASPLQLQILFDLETHCLEAKLPHLQLDFNLRPGETAITSRQFRRMQIDVDQSIGTLVGLKSKLVLRNMQYPQIRMILIPDGVIECKKRQHELLDSHVEVSVAYETTKHVQSYSIDNNLSRLVGNDTLQSKLFLAYLHGLTSYCLLDPLLRRTGTEQALSILDSASIRSVTYLTPNVLALLESIADLSPSRCFYPSHEKVMQVVKWSPTLSFLSQNGRFYQAVHEICKRTSDLGFLYPSNVTKPTTLKATKMDLVVRDIMRTVLVVAAGGARLVSSSRPDSAGIRHRLRAPFRAVLASDGASRWSKGSATLWETAF
ncbi:hypothetical protein AK830_g11108 [Neonectria ditissima]|uniref:Uncharacterized protein n=1 Tax=Neonectria ditissima TaxID=78410 RepID=A0A0P7ANB8_9HYPO|nr:hypothetical protein AK830_g11108 [Neonectria ditissima]